MEKKFHLEVAKRRRICGNCRQTIHPGECCLAYEGHSFKVKSNVCLGCLGIELASIPSDYGEKTFLKGKQTWPQFYR